MLTFVCQRCSRTLPEDCFGKVAREKSGRNGTCKECRNAISKASVQSNPEERKTQSRKYYASHKAEHSERVRKWVANNPETVREIANRSRAKNTEWAKAYRKRYGAEQLRKMRELYPERYKARNKVNNAIGKKKMRPAKDFQCTHCSAPATEYHHHKGYEEIYWLDVVPVCRACHAKVG